MIPFALQHTLSSHQVRADKGMAPTVRRDERKQEALGDCQLKT